MSTDKELSIQIPRKYLGICRCCGKNNYMLPNQLKCDRCLLAKEVE